MMHELKTWPGPFGAVWDGHKTYEIRTADRPFERGDTLYLLEYLPEARVYTGREMMADVTWMTRGPEWGIPEGMVVMAIRVTERRTKP